MEFWKKWRARKYVHQLIIGDDGASSSTQWGKILCDGKAAFFLKDWQLNLSYIKYVIFSWIDFHSWAWLVSGQEDECKIQIPYSREY